MIAATAIAVAGAYRIAMSPQSQVLGAFPYRSDLSRKVALTFDDGPNPPFTTELADFLDAEDIRGTFFQVGKAVRRHAEVTRRLFEAGHVIGNHSDNHELSRCLSARSLATEIADANQTFADLGIRPALFRPPWLLRVPALFPILRSHGLTPISGSFCHPMEVAQIQASRIARCAVRRTSAGSVLIFHDGFDGHAGNRASTITAIKQVVHALKDRGYEFATVPELLEIAAYR